MTTQAELNQTAFSSEEPLFESAGGASNHKSAELKKPNSGGIILLLIVIVVILIGYLFLRNDSKTEQESSITPTPTPEVQSQDTNTSVDQLLTELDETLQSADPSVNIFPFPPVSEEILVSPK